VKENKFSIIQDMHVIYHGMMLQGFETVSNANAVNVIRMLRQKTIDKKQLAENRRLGPEEVAIYNEIAARGDHDTNAYNERISNLTYLHER
jgi:hypothetical protein